MKKIFITLLLLTMPLLALNAQTKTTVAQKSGYVNTQTILESMPEYKSASESLDKMSQEYQSKIEQEYSKIETLYNNYQRQKSTMSAAMRTQKENEIISKEKSVKQLQQSYFGEDGIMQKKSDELMNPIKTKVQNAIDKVAKRGNYMIIFDIATMQGVVYTNTAADLSSEVIKEIKATK